MGKVVIKSKTNRATQIALGLAVIMMFMMLLVFLSGSKENGIAWNKILGVVILIVVAFWYLKRKSPPALTQYDIIKNTADSEFSRGKTLNTNPDRVNIERGGVHEWYVHFMNNHVTYLYLENVGVVETHIGKDIATIKRDKQNDTVTMKLAEIGIANHRTTSKLTELGLFNEEQV